jgi:hypothetical protein
MSCSRILIVSRLPVLEPHTRRLGGWLLVCEGRTDAPTRTRFAMQIRRNPGTKPARAMKSSNAEVPVGTSEKQSIRTRDTVNEMWRIW